MARTADHEQRRRQVAEALLRAVGERGLARTTLADVADRAGVSVGLVQSYFRTKSQLLRFGVEYLYKRGEERLDAVGRGEHPPASIRDWVLRAARTLLPLDDERRAELVVWLEFLPATLTDPDMSRLHRDTTAALVDGFARALAGARHRGELPSDTDVRAEAASLVAFVDGLTTHHLVTGAPYTEESIGAALETYLDRLFPAPESP